jgi:hypothetical protein
VVPARREAVIAAAAAEETEGVEATEVAAADLVVVVALPLEVVDAISHG